MAERPTLTTASGMPVADNQNTITAGPRGPVLMQDFHLSSSNSFAWNMGRAIDQVKSY
jgi:catalase